MLFPIVEKRREEASTDYFELWLLKKERGQVNRKRDREKEKKTVMVLLKNATLSAAFVDRGPSIWTLLLPSLKVAAI